MGTADIVWLVLISLTLYLIILIACLPSGVTLCKSNNALGILLLVIPLNVIGLIIGICLIYNAKNGKYDEWLKDRKKWKEFLKTKNKSLKEYLDNKVSVSKKTIKSNKK